MAALQKNIVDVLFKFYSFQLLPVCFLYFHRKGTPYNASFRLKPSNYILYKSLFPTSYSLLIFVLENVSYLLFLHLSYLVYHAAPRETLQKEKNVEPKEETAQEVTDFPIRNDVNKNTKHSSVLILKMNHLPQLILLKLQTTHKKSISNRHTQNLYHHNKQTLHCNHIKRTF